MDCRAPSNFDSNHPIKSSSDMMRRNITNKMEKIDLKFEENIDCSVFDFINDFSQGQLFSGFVSHLVYYNHIMQDSSSNRLGKDPLVRLKNLLVLIVKKLLVSYQIAVGVIGLVFLFIIALLVIFY